MAADRGSDGRGDSTARQGRTTPCRSPRFSEKIVPLSAPGAVRFKPHVVPSPGHSGFPGRQGDGRDRRLASNPLRSPPDSRVSWVLAELTDTQEPLAALADELAAFVRVAAIREDLLRRSDTNQEQLIRDSAVWATSAIRRHQVETWVAFRGLLQTVWSPWREHQFCEQVQAAGHPSRESKRLASIDRW